MVDHSNYLVFLPRELENLQCLPAWYLGTHCSWSLASAKSGRDSGTSPRSMAEPELSLADEAPFPFPLWPLPDFEGDVSEDLVLVFIFQILSTLRHFLTFQFSVLISFLFSVFCFLHFGNVFWRNIKDADFYSRHI